jgi:hypothetical protein
VTDAPTGVDRMTAPTADKPAVRPGHGALAAGPGSPSGPPADGPPLDVDGVAAPIADEVGPHVP